MFWICQERTYVARLLQNPCRNAAEAAAVTSRQAFRPLLLSFLTNVQTRVPRGRATIVKALANAWFELLRGSGTGRAHLRTISAVLESKQMAAWDDNGQAAEQNFDERLR